MSDNTTMMDIAIESVRKSLEFYPYGMRYYHSLDVVQAVVAALKCKFSLHTGNCVEYYYDYTETSSSS